MSTFDRSLRIEKFWATESSANEDYYFRVLFRFGPSSHLLPDVYPVVTFATSLRIESPCIRSILGMASLYWLDSKE